MTGALTSSSASAGIGYATGAGSTVTQITSRTTAVTINAVCGAITLVSAAGVAGYITFNVNNSTVAATDVPIVVQKSGNDLFSIYVTNIQAGRFSITFYDLTGTTVEQPVFNFIIHKSVAS